MKGSALILPRWYRNFALGFFGLSVMFLLCTAYIIWAGVTIVLTPSQQVSDYNLSFDVRQLSGVSLVAGEQGAVNGKIKQVTVQGQKIVDATGREVLSADSGIVGQVTITNNYSKDQTLVAATRLADRNDPDTVLARLKNAVVVPAGGSVTVPVYTEDIAGFKKIAPQRFIIPGLWQPLWDTIYAENAEPLQLQEQVIGVVTEQDVQTAQETLKNELYQQALEQINRQLEPQEALWPKLVSSQNSQVDFDHLPGDKVDTFTASMEVTANVVVFDEEQVIALARSSLSGDSGSLITVDPKTFSYTIEELNLQNNTATVSMTFKAASLAEAGAGLLDKSQLVGKTEAELEEYFSKFPEVGAVEVIFQPVWLKKTPRLVDKIKIEIK